MIEHANSFATIVGLLSAFLSGRESGKNAETTEFIAWLIEHNHNEIANSITQNQATNVGVKALLNQQLPLLQEKLSSISAMISAIGSKIDGFSELSIAVGSEIELSDQAFALIEQMHDGKVEFFLVSETMSGTRLITDNSVQLNYDEPIFIKDDILSLIKLGLLRLEYNNSGGEMLYITRLAYKVVAMSAKTL